MRSSVHPIPIGGLLAVAVLPVHALLPTAAADALAALLLVLIAGIYLGFAALDGRPSRLAVETGAAVGFLAFAPVVAPRGRPRCFRSGTSLTPDGTWLTATRASAPACPRWYVPFCVVVDVVAAVGIAVSRAVGG